VSVRTRPERPVQILLALVAKIVGESIDLPIRRNQTLERGFRAEPDVIPANRRTGPRAEFLSCAHRHISLACSGWHCDVLLD
jgi:hypothetical protein